MAASKVGVIDGGVDFTHPDLAGAIDVAASCSFIYSHDADGRPGGGRQRRLHATRPRSRTCRATARTWPRRSPAGVNGIGIAGVAPEATIVALKACTIAGFCFADSVAAALRYAGDQRLDVVNLSLFADPYLYFCGNDAEQRAILAGSAERRPVRPAARRRDRGRGRQRGRRTSATRRPTTSARTGRRTPPSCARSATTAGSRRPSCPVSSPCRPPASRTLASYSNVGSPVDVTAPGGDAAQTPATTFGRGRILAGWSSTDAHRARGRRWPPPTAPS